MSKKITEQLSFLKDLINELQEKNIQSHKIEVLTKYKQKDEKLLRKLLSYTYDFDKTYGVTSKNVEKYIQAKKTIKDNKYDDLFELLNDLKNRKVTGHEAIQTVISNNDKNKTIYFIINKDLKSQISTKIINKVLPGCIKEWNVALANKIQDQKEEAQYVQSGKYILPKGEWIIERKLDGVRCIAMIDEDENVHFISRQGRPFDTLENLKEPVKKILLAAKKQWKKPFVLDGECCMMNEKGDEDFSAVMQEITMKNHTIDKPKYVVFDLISEEEFFQTVKCSQIYKNRLENLEKMVDENPSDKIKVVENIKESSQKIFTDWLDKAEKNDWEGLCIRLRDSLFQAKRTNDLIKVKKFMDEEFIVKDVEIGKMKMLENGKMVEKTCVKSLIIEAEDGTKFNCGSGLSTEQRLLWMEHPELIKGCQITVQYFSKSIDKKTGIPSLRFPTLKYVYDKKLGRQI